MNFLVFHVSWRFKDRIYIIMRDTTCDDFEFVRILVLFYLLILFFEDIISSITSGVQCIPFTSPYFVFKCIFWSSKVSFKLIPKMQGCLKNSFFSEDVIDLWSIVCADFESVGVFVLLCLLVLFSEISCSIVSGVQFIPLTLTLCLNIYSVPHWRYNSICMQGSFHMKWKKV